MKKNTFFKTTLILMIGGFITKILGMIIKIVMSRLLTTEGIGLYMIIMPTFSLVITLAQLGFPIAISKFIAEDKKNNKNLIFSLIPVSLLVNFLIIILLFIFARFISINLLKDSRVYLPIIAMSLVIPFTSISSILRSYFFGKQKMIPHVVSNIIEDIVRLIILIIGIPIFIKYGLEKAVSFVILSNIVSELASILVLFFFLPKNFQITKKDLKPNKQYIKDSLNIGVPNTLGRLIGSIGYFFEPIILTYSLLINGYSNKYIIYQYGVLSGYVIPLLLLPSFFTMAISQALLPIVSKNYSRGDKFGVQKKLKQAIVISLIIGILYTIVIILKPEVFLKIIYNTNEGVNYIKILAPVCILQYIQAPLSFTLDGLGKSKISMISTLIGTIIRCILLFGTSFLHIGIYSLIIATSANIIIVTLYQIKAIKKVLKN